MPIRIKHRSTSPSRLVASALHDREGFAVYAPPRASLASDIDWQDGDISHRLADSRLGCSFCLYVPSDHPLSRLYRYGSMPAASYDSPRHRSAVSDPTSPDGTLYENRAVAFPPLVLIHSSRNGGQMLRDAWSDWAEAQRVVLLSVIFP